MISKKILFKKNGYNAEKNGYLAYPKYKHPFDHFGFRITYVNFYLCQAFFKAF